MIRLTGLMAFDGFEDYDYKDEPCEPYCKPSKRHWNTGITTGQLVSTEAHTGRHSLMVNTNSTLNIDIKSSADDRVINPDLRIKVNTAAVEGITRVLPNGRGLKGYYYNDMVFSTLADTRVDEKINLSFEGSDDPGRLPCNPKKNGGKPSEQHCNQISMKWKGSVQVERSGYYQFDLSSVDDEAWIYVTDNTSTVVQAAYANYHRNQPHILQQVYLTAGTLHTIEIRYIQYSYDGYINLVWRQPGPDGNQNPSIPYTSIPSKNLYPEGEESLASGTVLTSTVYCTKPDTIQAINHQLIDSFNLVPGTKMIASMWVKKGGTDCACNSYDDLNLRIKNTSGITEGKFMPREKVIEGWQLFEAEFDVPEGYSKLILELNAPSGDPLYVDDLRFHPFNANMKSFVYDPVTLRLVAELDENNFAAFYEYDDEGTLIRTKKETRLGVKTITETRSAIQKEVKDL
jgi:hypothetical protein